jgi:hypothetical protein
LASRGPPQCCPPPGGASWEPPRLREEGGGRQGGQASREVDGGVEGKARGTECEWLLGIARQPKLQANTGPAPLPSHRPPWYPVSSSAVPSCTESLATSSVVPYPSNSTRKPPVEPSPCTTPVYLRPGSGRGQRGGWVGGRERGEAGLGWSAGREVRQGPAPSAVQDAAATSVTVG